MPPPDIEARIIRAQEGISSPLAQAITRRAFKEARLMQARMLELRGRTAMPPQDTVYDPYLLDATERAAMVYLPQSRQTAWPPESYYEFSDTRRRFIQDQDILVWDHLPVDKLDDPKAQQEATRKARNTNNVLHMVLGGASLFVPAVGAADQLIRMEETAHNIARFRLRDETLPDVPTVYLDDVSYVTLQREYYGYPENMELERTEALEVITGDTMARYRAYNATGTMPDAGTLFVTAEHEEEAAMEKAHRLIVLYDRINALWPKKKTLLT